MRISKMIVMTMIATSVVLCSFSIMGPSSSGAPASHTGAPGEKTCATAGCHDDNAMNAGDAQIQIDFSGGLNYAPKRTYEITIHIQDSGVNRFGFQIIALQDQSSTNAGKFKITDTERTQLATNTVELSLREYVTYTFNGTDAISLGNGEWKLKWRAPDQSNETITFYVGAVSANDDETDKGDFVYTQKLSISPIK